MDCFRLFFEFFKTGAFAIGGGMATIPFLYEMAETTGWFTGSDLADMIAVSESTPGPIGVNMATYVGCVTGMKAGGLISSVLGAVTATLGLIAPSILIILIIATFLKTFRDNLYVKNVFYGLRPASAGLIAAAGIGVMTENLFSPEFFRMPFSPASFSISSINVKGWILACLLWLLTNKIKKTRSLHPVFFIAASAAAGVLFSMG